MTARDLLDVVTQGVFVLVFIVVGFQAMRRPTRANIDTALLFGAVAFVLIIGRVSDALGLEDSRPMSAISLTLIMAIPYLLLRLVDDFATPPRWLMRFGAAAFVVMGAIGVAVTEPYPIWFDLLLMVWFVGMGAYVATAFIREAARTGGVTRRRMQAVAAGTIFIAMAIALAVVGLVIPVAAPVTTVLSPLVALATAVAYYIGFAPPAILRRAWQEPELRAFLARAARLPRLESTRAIVAELERGAAESTGAPSASLALWDPGSERLVVLADGEELHVKPGEGIVGRAYEQSQSIFSANAPRDDPKNAQGYIDWGARAVIASPISSGEKKIGVLSVYAPRPPIFEDDDIGLVSLLADQAAVILESRALIDEATRVRATEEATRLKDDFLSAAAHDLKTPLTSMLAQAQLLEYRVKRDPQAPAPLETIRAIVAEARRLKDLVVKLLDASRVDQARQTDRREHIDLVAVARESCERWSTARHQCTVDAPEPVEGEYDPVRIGQLFDNLVENAIKYSPKGGDVTVKVWRDDGEARISVSDRGIGIPPEDLQQIFDRFQRAGNVDDRQFAGMGLGLFICQQVVREHEGRIWVTSTPGVGSTFHVALPVTEAAAALSEVA